MSFFGKILGYLNPKNQPNGIIALPEDFPQFNYQIEFLKRLNKTPSSKLFGENTYWEGRFTELLGDLTVIIKKFHKENLLEISLKEESLTIKQLKEILRENNLPLAGNKEILALRVKDQVQNKSYLKGIDSFFKVTRLGENQINSYLEKFESDYVDFLKNQADIFTSGNFSKLEKNHFLLDQAHPDQRSLGANFDEFTTRTKSILNQIASRSNFYFDWKMTDQERQKIKAALAIRAIIFSNNERFISKYLGIIDFSEFKKFLNQSNLDSDSLSEFEIIDYFLKYEFQFLWNNCKIKELKKLLEKEPSIRSIAGIQIINEGCKCQETFGEEKFKRLENNIIPKLPRHATCTCFYNGFYEE
ncbi:MAG: SAP domain-containing protein [Algoriphagus sp.]|uniref:SAP domain-containing protein n=1 Tax=Algoriphagus sp. TaxID=1872435 RepID=UPI00261E88A7|nr:SAP domain-containing protein [Algoriphagus sp.]MDG1276094.1 SAP domain-containing protein [Algoriphagus sp.]